MPASERAGLERRLRIGLSISGILLGAAALLVSAVLPAHAAARTSPSDMGWIDPWAPAPEEPEEQAAASTRPTLGAEELQKLSGAIALYRRIEARGGWPRIPDGEPLEKGVSDPRVALLKQRLAATGDLAGSTGDAAFFDGSLFNAVRRFQARNGIPADGAVGRATLDALNVPVAARLRQLEINMKRLSAVAPSLGQRYVFVNIAGQQVEAVDRGRLVMRKRVIVGKDDRQTPEYSSSIASVTLNPYWNVPQSIAVKDLLPKIRSNPGFLGRMGIRVLRADGTEVAASSVDWRAADVTRKYRLRQDPSRLNSLGTVRINFPNPYSVFLHDTPVKSLFDRKERTFSSGCVRVEDVRDLAAWLLADAGWTRTRIDGAIAAGGHVDVPLARHVPIYMLYLTAWVGEDGLVHFRDDAYDRDRKLSAAN